MIKSDCQHVDRRSHTDGIRCFFDETERYLTGNGNIEIRQKVVKEMAGDVQNARILDLGCGDGRIGLQFASASNSLTLVDVSSKMLETARSRTPAAFRTMVKYVNEDLAVYRESSKYDLVLCLGVLAHVDSIEATIQRISDLLRIGGRCILQITDSDRILGRLSVAYCDVRNRINGRYPKALNRAGVIRIQALAAKFRMECIAERRYASLLPGMGRMPLSLRSRIQLVTLRTPWLSDHCSEAVLLFSRAV